VLLLLSPVALFLITYDVGVMINLSQWQVLLNTRMEPSLFHKRRNEYPFTILLMKDSTPWK
jgi:hypothetical protein